VFLNTKGTNKETVRLKYGNGSDMQFIQNFVNN